MDKKIGILSKPNTSTTISTIKYFQANNKNIDVVICETKNRSKFSLNEKNFIKNHQKFEKYLRKTDINYLFKKIIQKVKRKFLKQIEIKELCKKKNICYIEVEKHSSVETRNKIHELEIDYLFLNASSWLIKGELLDNVNFKIINLHNALLPNYRGLDAMMYSILDNNKIGLSAHIIDKGIDTGPIVGFKEIERFKRENIFELRARLDNYKPIFIYELIDRLNSSPIDFIIQDTEKGRHCNAIDFEKLVEVNELYRSGKETHN